jgi:hypothetical protein
MEWNAATHVELAIQIKFLHGFTRKNMMVRQTTIMGREIV